MFTSDKDLRKPVPKKAPIAKTASAANNNIVKGGTTANTYSSSANTVTIATTADPTITTGIDIVEKSRLEREERHRQRDLQLKVIFIQRKWRGILTRRKLFLHYCQSLTSRLADITKLSTFMRQQKNIELRLPVSTAVQLLKTALFICSDRFMTVHRRILIIHRLYQQHNTSPHPTSLPTHPWELLIQVSRVVIPSINNSSSDEKNISTSTASLCNATTSSKNNIANYSSSHKTNTTDTYLSLDNSEVFLLFLRTILLFSHIFNEKCHSLSHSDISIAYEETLVQLCIPVVSYLHLTQIQDYGYDIQLLTEAVENILLLRNMKLLQLSEEDTCVATLASLRHRATQPISLERLFLDVYLPLLSLIVATKTNNKLSNNNNDNNDIDEEVACGIYRTRLWNIPLWPLLISETALWQLAFSVSQCVSNVCQVSQSAHSLCRRLVCRDIIILASQYQDNVSRQRYSDRDTSFLLRHMVSPLAPATQHHCHLSRVLSSIQPLYVSMTISRYRDTVKQKTGLLAAGVLWVSSLCCLLVTGMQGEVVSRCVTGSKTSVPQNLSRVVDSCLAGVSRLLVLFPLHATHRETSSVVYVSQGVSSVAVAVPAVLQRVVQLLFEPAMLRVLLVSTIKNVHLYCENNTINNINNYNNNTNNDTFTIGQVSASQKSEEVLRCVATHLSDFTCHMEEWCVAEEVQDMKRLLSQSDTIFSSASVVRDTLRHAQKQTQKHSLASTASTWAKKLGLISHNNNNNYEANNSIYYDLDTPKNSVSRESNNKNKKSIFSSWFSTKIEDNKDNANTVIGDSQGSAAVSRHLVEVRRFRLLLILRLFSQLLFSGVETHPGHTVWHAFNILCHGTPLLHLLLFQIFVPSSKQENENDSEQGDGGTIFATKFNDDEERWRDSVGHADTVLTTLFSSCSVEEVLDTLSLCRILPVHLLELPLSAANTTPSTTSSTVSRHTKTQESSSFFSNFRLFQNSKTPSSMSYASSQCVATQLKRLSLFVSISLLQHALLSTDDDELYNNKGCVPLSICLPLIRSCTSLYSQHLLHSETALNNDHYHFSTTSIFSFFSSLYSQTEDEKEVEERGAENGVLLNHDPLLRLLYTHYMNNNKDDNNDNNRILNNDYVVRDTVVSQMCRETQHSLLKAHIKLFHSAFHVFMSRLLRDLHSRWTRRAFSSSPEIFYLKRFHTHNKTENDEFVRHMCLALPHNANTPIADISMSRHISGHSSRISGVSQLLRHLPFSVPFLLRLQWFRYVLDTQRVDSQGTAPTVTHTPLYGVSVTGGFRTAGHTLTVRRSRLLQDALAQLRHTLRRDTPRSHNGNISMWHDRFIIKYVNDFGEIETGQDAGGLFKDFFTALTEEAFHPSFGLFSLTENKLCLYPNPSAQLLFQDPHELAETFRFLGRLLGKALYENIAIAPQFAPFFLSLMSQNKDNNLQFYTHLLSELQTFDPELTKNLLFLKNYEGDVSDLELTFTVTDTLMGQVVERDILPTHYHYTYNKNNNTNNNNSNNNRYNNNRKGRDTPVTQQNRHLYVACVAKYYLHDRLQPQAEHFFKGLRDLVPVSLLNVFSAAEWQLVISGDTQQSRGTFIQDLKRSVQYTQGYSSFDPVILRFWSLVENEALFSSEDVSLLLQFVTACPRPPSLGFQTLTPPFTIQRYIDNNHTTNDTNNVHNMHLPAASTCFNILKLPPYPTVEIMRDKLLQAIRAKAGFDLV